MVQLAALQGSIQLAAVIQDIKLYTWLLLSSVREFAFFHCSSHFTALGATHAVHNSHQYQSPRTAYL